MDTHTLTTSINFAEIIGRLIIWAAPFMGAAVWFAIKALGKKFLTQFESITAGAAEQKKALEGVSAQLIALNSNSEAQRQRLDVVDKQLGEIKGTFDRQISEIRGDVSRALLLGEGLTKNEKAVEKLIGMVDALHKRMDKTEKKSKSLQIRFYWLATRITVIKEKLQAETKCKFENDTWDYSKWLAENITDGDDE